MRVGIVGAGKISERHIHGYKSLNDIEIFVSDVDSNIAQKLSGKLGVNFAASPEVVIGDTTIDIIDVCTPTLFHKDYILNAIEAGKHVFCEKPLCQNIDEAMEIKKAAEGTDRYVMAGYLYRFHPGFQLAKQILDDGIIGEPHYAIFRLGGRGSHRHWKHTRAAGGGVIKEMLVHKLDLILWYFGEAVSVKTLINDRVLSKRTIRGNDIDVDAEDYVLLDLKVGHTRVLCQSDLITPSYMDYAEIHGDNGSIFTSILSHFPTVIHCNEARSIYNAGTNFRNYSTTNLFGKELGHFVDAIKNGAKNLNSIDESIEIFKVIEKIQ